MRKKIITGCNDCPFNYIDEYGVEECNMGGDPWERVKPGTPYMTEDQVQLYPDNCPLIDEEIIVKLQKEDGTKE